MIEPTPYFSNLERGCQLMELQRPREAVNFFQAAIAADPHQATAYAELAHAWIALGNPRAIDAIDHAIALEPNLSIYQGLKGWYLVCLMRYHAALRCADAGLAINPNCIQSLNARANAYTKLGNWTKAEEACRRILAIIPYNTGGLNLLAQALRHEGRYKESREVVARILAQTPNDSFGQANAGHAALTAGDYLRANYHFLEALRIDPHSTYASQGLLESLKARNWINRANTRLYYMLPRARSRSGRMLVFAGIVVAAMVLPSLVVPFTPPWAMFPMVLILMGIAGWIYVSVVALVLSRVALIFDPIGRHALSLIEKIRIVASSLIVAWFALVSFASHLTSAGVAFIASFVIIAVIVQAPLWYDRIQQRRLDQAAT